MDSEQRGSGAGLAALGLIVTLIAAFLVVLVASVDEPVCGPGTPAGGGDLPISADGTAPPTAYGVQYQPAPYFFCATEPCTDRDALPPWLRRELFAVSVMTLHGLFLPGRESYHWLYSSQPIATIGYSILVYDITGDADAHLQLARLYAEEGSRHPALMEQWRAGRH